MPAIRAVVLVTVIALTACGEEAPEIQERVRAIKTMTVTEPASGALRDFSGIVQATDTSSLSFAVAGTVRDVNAELGESVGKGQVLARLDPANYEIEVDAARSELMSAQAVAEEKKVDYDRQKTLFEKDWVSQAALDQAESAYESSASQVNLAEARLERAQRDVNRTVLRAPFDGTIAEKSVEPFLEVKAGEELFQLNAQGALEVQLSIPESLIGQFSLGMPVTVDLTNDPNCGCEGRVTEIASVAESANAYPVKVGLLDPPADVRPGMTAKTTFTLSEGLDTLAYLIPVIAMAPGVEDAGAFVYKFDAASSTVQKTRVEIRTAVRGNWIAVADGLQAGDVIAVAGVSMLNDGQKVTLLSQ